MALQRKDVYVGQSRDVVIVDDLTRTQLVMYAGASGDYHPRCITTRCSRPRSAATQASSRTAC
jgi:hypothetical protein